MSTSTCFSSLTEEVLTLEQFFCGNFSSFARFLKWNLCKFMWHFLLQYIATIKSLSKEETNCRKKIWHSVKHQRRRDEKFNYLRCSFGSFSSSRLFFLLLRLLNKFFVIFPLHFCTYFTPQNKISCLYRIFTSVNSCHVCETDCTFYDINTNIFLGEVLIIFHQIMHPLKSLKIDDFTSTISRLNFSLFFFRTWKKKFNLDGAPLCSSLQLVARSHIQSHCQMVGTLLWLISLSIFYAIHLTQTNSCEFFHSLRIEKKG